MAISTAKEQVWCASPDWSVGGLSGWGIPAGSSRIGVHRTSPAFRADPRRALRYGELNDVLATDGERQAILVERGYLVPYFRKSFWDRAKFEARARAKGRIP